MIIENEGGQDLDYYFYDLMEHSVRVQRKEERVIQFIKSYHAIQNNDVHNVL
jgi:hypothetical protein